VQDYKSLCIAATICVTLVHTQTDTQMSTHRDSILSAYMKSSASWAKKWTNLPPFYPSESSNVFSFSRLRRGGCPFTC